jgi:alpha-L-fucosidase 2
MFALLVSVQVSHAQSAVSPYNVVWNTPSDRASGSMPLGNGDIGLNVWVESGGDLVFYISKTDAWSENLRLLKLGRVRVRLNPNPFAAGAPFTQKLDVQTGEIVITAGKPGSETKLTLRIDANQPLITIEAESSQDVEMQVLYERWRNQQRVLEGSEMESAFGFENSPEPLLSYGDSLQMDAENRVVWYHRDTKSPWPGILKLQGLQETMVSLEDPILNRTFGAAMEGDGFSRMNPIALRNRTPGRRQRVSIYPLTSIAGSTEQWLGDLDRLIARVKAIRPEDLKSAHDRWWRDFWDRSSVRITGGAEQEAVSRGYVLQRFLNACAGRGAYPIKSNGSIFTMDAKVEDNSFDADYRKLGGPYFFQKTRLIYWPMLASGDFDLIMPFFRMYQDSQFLAERRTKFYFNHEGAFFPETMYFFGAYPNSLYGWQRQDRPPSYVESGQIRYQFSSSLELLAMLLEYHAYTQDKRFAGQTIVPLAERIVDFYDKHYTRDGDGKIRFAPAQSLDMWLDVVNPMPEIAGLRYVLDGILDQKIAIGKQHVNAAKRMLGQMPDLPQKEINGKTLLQPAAEMLSASAGTQNPELSAVFPYRIYGVGKNGLDLARATFEARRFKQSGGWREDAIEAALLGFAAEARKLTEENFSTHDAEIRFPGFFGPSADWPPDQDQGNVGMMALQSMLMQTEGNKITLFPAWPKDWDVEFKLQAPLNTTVEGVYKAGKLESLKVTPDKRKSDVIKMDPQ